MIYINGYITTNYLVVKRLKVVGLKGNPIGTFLQKCTMVAKVSFKIP